MTVKLNFVNMNRSIIVFVILVFFGFSCQNLSETKEEFTEKPLKKISLTENLRGSDLINKSLDNASLI